MVDNDTPKKCDAVFEGGGTNGIALCGAAFEIENAGYEFNQCAGTSAGAIMAALLAVGYDAEALVEIIYGVDYRRFKDKSLMDMVPVIGPLASLFKNKGYYGGDYFLGWMRDLIRSSPTRAEHFGDLKGEDGKYRLHMIASDITRERMLILPESIGGYKGYDPDDLEVALAARMSMSIPIFFEPIKLTHPNGYNCHIVDGGLLSNFPVWLFDRTDGQLPRWPTFGFRLTDKLERDKANPIGGPIDLVKSMVTTMLNARDISDADTSNSVRTIDIDTLGHSGMDFDVTELWKSRLLREGRTAASNFLVNWDFDKYVADFRQRN